MQENDPGGFAARNVRFFRALAIVVGVGFVGALLLAFGMGSVQLNGFFEPQAFQRGLFLMSLVTAVGLILFLLRIGVIFDVERQVRGMFESEAERLDAARRQEAEDQRAFRDDMRRDLQALRGDFLKELNQRDQMYDGAMRAANQAAKAAADALARVEALSREPAYRSTIENLVRDLADMKKDLQALRTADKVNSPLLKELQEKVLALETGQKKLNIRVDETMEGIERRDMEQASIRATLDHELANLKKRESLLLLKQKDLEDNNVQLSVKARAVPTAFAPGEEKQHVLTVEAIGPVYASRLNAAGIITVPQLIAADPEQLAARIDAMPNVVSEWQAIAQIMRLKGVSPQAAEVLVRSGVTSVKQLATQDPEELSGRIRELEKTRKVRAQGVDTSASAALRWIAAAREGKYEIVA